MLWLAASEKGYASAHWFTYRQAAALGGQVRKGEKSTTVVKYGTVEKTGEDGEERKIPFARAYAVFNSEQIDGLPERFYTVPEPPRDLGTKTDPELEAFFAATGVPVVTSAEPQACYDRVKDIIHMPPVATFYDANGYFSTLAHEEIHAVGHSSRLDRFGSFSGKADLAFEELIAEIGACMVCARLGLVPAFDQSAAYVEGWLTALGDDARAIFRASSAAQKAADFIFATDPRETGEAA